MGVPILLLEFGRLTEGTIDCDQRLSVFIHGARRGAQARFQLSPSLPRRARKQSMRAVLMNSCALSNSLP